MALLSLNFRAQAKGRRMILVLLFHISCQVFWHSRW